MAYVIPARLPLLSQELLVARFQGSYLTSVESEWARGTISMNTQQLSYSSSVYPLSKCCFFYFQEAGDTMCKNPAQ